MKSKRRASEGKKKTNITVNNSSNAPTPEVMLYDTAKHYSKYKDYEKFMSLKQSK